MKMRANKAKRLVTPRNVLVLVSLLFITGCSTTKNIRQSSLDKLGQQFDVLQGPTVTNNTTPLDQSFACVANAIHQEGRTGLAISVGNIKDYTGKFSENDGGNAITQGGALMVSSALGKLSDVIQIRERFDTQIAEVELSYLNKQYLGDGNIHRISDGQSQVVKEVPWLPYRGGTIMKTDYYIVGGITELNYNIQSGGAEAIIAGYGAQGRTFAINIAVDLRIVNASTLNVEKSISLQKQLVGYEVGASLFRFFENRLFDLNVGSKRQEPLQLGVRTALEIGVIELVGHVAETPVDGCLYDYLNPNTAQQADVGELKSVESEQEATDQISEVVSTDPVSADSVSADSVSADSVSADSVSADSVSADSVSADSGSSSNPLTRPLLAIQSHRLAVGSDSSNYKKALSLGSLISEI